MRPPDMSSLFSEEPHTWGLRGDPHLWREMREATIGRPLPESASELRGVLGDLFEQLTGASMDGEGPVVVERYATGGMSSGRVSREFWRQTAVPLLERRWEASTGGPGDGYTER